MSEQKFEVGAALAPMTFPVVNAQQLKDYSKAALDPNPIHLDETIAKKMGLPGIIAHGMLIAAWMGEAGMRWATHDWKLQLFKTRFQSMTFLGDVIQVTGSVKEVSENALVIAMAAKNQKGETVTSGEIRLVK